MKHYANPIFINILSSSKELVRVKNYRLSRSKGATTVFSSNDLDDLIDYAEDNDLYSLKGDLKSIIEGTHEIYSSPYDDELLILPNDKYPSKELFPYTEKDVWSDVPYIRIPFRAYKNEVESYFGIKPILTNPNKDYTHYIGFTDSVIQGVISLFSLLHNKVFSEDTLDISVFESAFPCILVVTKDRPDDEGLEDYLLYTKEGVYAAGTEVDGTEHIVERLRNLPYETCAYLIKAIGKQVEQNPLTLHPSLPKELADIALKELVGGLVFKTITPLRNNHTNDSDLSNLFQ